MLKTRLRAHTKRLRCAVIKAAHCSPRDMSVVFRRGGFTFLIVRFVPNLPTFSTRPAASANRVCPLFVALSAGFARFIIRRDALVASVAARWNVDPSASGMTSMPLRYGFRRDPLVGSAWRDALVASVALRLILHVASAGVTGTPLRYGHDNHAPLFCLTLYRRQIRRTHWQIFAREKAVG